MGSRREVLADGTAQAKAQRHETRAHSMITTVDSQSGTFTLNLHSSSMRLEILLPFHRKGNVGSERPRDLSRSHSW